jgi:hypothetical protein
VGAAAPPSTPSAPAAGSAAPNHYATCHFAGCRRAETAHRSATDQTPDSDRVTLGQGILRALTIGCVKGGEAIT